jgi:hypothetical protein
MITFKHRSLEKPHPQTIKDIPVNDQWFIKTCEFNSGAIMNTFINDDIKTQNKEIAITNQFTVCLKHDANRGKIDLYAVNIIYLDINTRTFKRQSLRYYTMYSTKTFNITDDITFMNHLKMSLSNKSLNPLFPYPYVK